MKTNDYTIRMEKKEDYREVVAQGTALCVVTFSPL